MLKYTYSVTRAELSLVRIERVAIKVRKREKARDQVPETCDVNNELSIALSIDINHTDTIRIPLDNRNVTAETGRQ